MSSVFHDLLRPYQADDLQSAAEESGEGESDPSHQDDRSDWR